MKKLPNTTNTVTQQALKASSSVSTAKPIAYTLGEPAGIGADIIILLAQKECLSDIICIGDSALLLARAELMNLPIKLVSYPGRAKNIGELSVYQHSNLISNMVGTPSVQNVPAILSVLNTAIDGCISGEFSAMVTGPLHKGIINDSGIVFSGHTEYLAERTKAALPVMLLASDKLRVALITTHLALKDVSAAITEKAIMRVCNIIDRDLRTKYGIKKPRLLVCGLNPHAGEGGHMGMEEIEVIVPALDKLRSQGLDIIGPLPADTLFTQKYLEDADVAVAMYHDQGLPVLKAMSFGRAANITLGLPIIRTSVDHGTAFDLAGTGSADIGSLQTAIDVARQMSSAANN